jgi:hypothetical protein
MSRFLLAALATASLYAGQKPADAPPGASIDSGPTAVVQGLFDAMASRNADAARVLFVPDASLYSLGANGKANRMPLDDFLKVLGSGNVEWKERIWDMTVLVHGPLAVIWAPYDFHLGGSFTHCGYDSINLLKTAAGWKITYISDTRETQGCVNPLGPPAR